MGRIALLFVGMVLGLMLAVPAMATDYDLVILSGRVMDPETMYDDIANVGVKDGKIAAITKDQITGKETIDATGLVVAPGFIDCHFHYPKTMGYKVALRDGRITLMDLDKVDLSPGAKPMTLQLGVPGDLSGEVSSKLVPAEPFKFIAP